MTITLGRGLAGTVLVREPGGNAAGQPLSSGRVRQVGPPPPLMEISRPL